MSFDPAAGEAHLREIREVRRLAADYFADASGTPVIWRETVLLVDSHYRGRRFDFARGAAVWSPGEGSIAILVDGKLVDCLALDAHDSTAAMPLAKAA